MSKNKPIPKEHSLLTDKREITYWLNAHKIQNFYIHENEVGQFVVDVFTDVNLSNIGLSAIEVQFNSVAGDFDISRNNLYYLKGCPSIVKGSFSCNTNSLQSLQGGPLEVERYYNCAHNRLTNLIGSPKCMEYYFNASFNQLTTLEGCPETLNNGEFNVSHNKLETLAYFPQHMLSSTDLKYNRKLGSYQSLFLFEDIYSIHLAHREQSELSHILAVKSKDALVQKNKASKI